MSDKPDRKWDMAKIFAIVGAGSVAMYQARQVPAVQAKVHKLETTMSVHQAVDTERWSRLETFMSEQKTDMKEIKRDIQELK